MRVLALLSLVVLSAGVISAQNLGRIEGKILPPKKKVVAILPDPPDSISNAFLRLVSSGDDRTVKETITDVAGNFVFEGIPAGKYYIVAGCNYCTESTIRSDIVEIRPGRTSQATIQLPEQIQETVTISAGKSQPIDEVSKTANVIDGREMRERADFSLVDTLRTIPGFRVQQLGGFGRTASIKTRGLRNQDTALLIDGIRFRDAASITGDATPFLSDFTLTSVDRIEVLRGSGSSLYGTNAIGGVIDFRTPSPRTGWHGQLSGAAGALGLGRGRGNLSYGTPDSRFGFNAGVSRTVFTRGIDGNDDASNTNAQGRVDLSPTTSTSISGRIFASSAFVKLNSDPTTLGNLPPSNFGVIDARAGVSFASDADDPDDFQRSRFLNGQLVVTHASPKWLLQGFYSGLTTYRKNKTGPLGVGFQSDSLNEFEGAIQTANARVDWVPKGSNRITIGYEFEHEIFRNESASSFFPSLTTRASQSGNSIYVQALFGLLDDRLQLAAGSRIQTFALSQPRFSSTSPLSDISLDDPPTSYTFDGAASYYVRSTGTKFRSHVGNGYRVPSLYERFSSFFGFEHPGRLFLAGAPDLMPERSVALDAGFEQNLMKDRIRLTATYFYTRLIDAIGYGFLPQPDRFGRQNSETFGGYLNTSGFISRGLELSGRAKPTSSTDIFSSYTWTNSDQRTPQVAGSGVIASLGIPQHQFTFIATQRIKKFWANFDLLVTSSYLAPIFSSKTFNSYVYRFAGNRRGDVTAGYNFGWKKDRLNLRLFGTIENVFDNKYFENGFRTPGINGRIGLAMGF